MLVSVRRNNLLTPLSNHGLHIVMLQEMRHLKNPENVGLK